jgi:hypothetical protein
LRGHEACQIYALDPHVVRFHPENPGSDVLGEERTDQSDPRSLHSCFSAFFKRRGRLAPRVGYRNVSTAMPKKKKMGEIAQSIS